MPPTLPVQRTPAGLRIKETKEVYEGEVTELTPVETENPGGGYGKVHSCACSGRAGCGRDTRWQQQAVRLVADAEQRLPPRPRRPPALGWLRPCSCICRQFDHAAPAVPPPSAGGQPRRDRAEDRQGHQAAEARPHHLRLLAGGRPVVDSTGAQRQTRCECLSCCTRRLRLRQAEPPGCAADVRFCCRLILYRRRRRGSCPGTSSTSRPTAAL